MKAIDALEQVGRTLDQGDQGPHGDRDAPLREIAADTIERSQEHELLVDESGEPLTGDLRTLVRCRQRPPCRAAAAAATRARRTSDEPPALVLLHDVQLLLDQLLSGIQRRAAAVTAGIGPQRVLLGLEMLGYRLAARGSARLLLARLGRRLLRRRRPMVERALLRRPHGRGWGGRLLGGGNAALSLSDGEQLGDAVVERSDLLEDLSELSAKRGVVTPKSLRLLLGHGGRGSRRSIAVDHLFAGRRAEATIPTAAGDGEVDASEDGREGGAVDLHLPSAAVERRQLKAPSLEALAEEAPARAVEPQRLCEAPAAIHEEVQVP